MTLRRFRADLHIHTCLSPCGDLEMLPRGIVEGARARGIDMIGVCDHNSAENLEAVLRAAEGAPLRVLPGVEVTTREEVHILGIFEDAREAEDLQELVYAHLGGENDENFFGEQVVVDERGEVLRLNKRLLIGATTLSVDQVVGAIVARGGMAVASHVDRPSFSIVSQLGMVPEGMPFDALELSPNLSPDDARERFPDCRRYPLLRSSDAHFLRDIGRATTLFGIQEPTLSEVRKALRGEAGRWVEC